MKYKDKSIIKSSGIIGVATFISRVLGFVRDVIIASIFGAGFVADSFFIAFRVPNIIRKLMAEGTLSSGLVPEFTALISDGKNTELNRVASSVVNIVALAMLFVLLPCFIYADKVVWLLAPGFKNPSLAVKEFTWMLPYLFFIAITVVFIAFIYAHQSFLSPSLTPIILNATIIISALLFAEELSLLSLALGVLLGGVIQTALQVFISFRKGFRYTPCFDYKNSVVKKIFSHLFSSIWGLSVGEINIIVSMQLASFLPNGSISFLYYANRVSQFPLGIFGVAIGVAVLPVLCQNAAEKDTKQLLETLRLGISLVLFFVVPSVLGLIVLRKPIVWFLFVRGAFTPADALQTSYALVGYSIGLCFLSLLKVITPAFYSIGEYKLPSRAASIAVAGNLFLGALLMVPLKHTGLALANSLAGGINLLVLLVAIRKTIGKIGAKHISIELAKNILAALIMSAALIFFDMSGPCGAAELFFRIAFGFTVYVGSAFCLRCEAIIAIPAYFYPKK